MKILQRFTLASLLLSGAAFTNAALAADNCQNVMDGVTQEWGAVAWGPALGCYSPNPALAKQDGGTACLALLAQGVLGRAEHREVHLWWGGPSEGTVEIGVTHLGYCAGNRPATTLNEEKAKEQQKEMAAKIKK
jgi:hypothetical protein